MHDHDYSEVQKIVINSGLLVCGIVYTCLVGQHCYVVKIVYGLEVVSDQSEACICKSV